MESVHVPEHLVPPGSPQAKQLCHLHAKLSLRHSCHRQKKVLHLCTQGHFSSVRLLVTLQTVACQAFLSGRGFSRQEYWSVLANTGAYWPTLVTLPSRALYFLLPQLPTPLSTWCCQNPCNPSSCTASLSGPHRGKPKSSRGASGANPSGRPTCRGGNKTTIETQEQYG